MHFCKNLRDEKERAELQSFISFLKLLLVSLNRIDF